MSLPEPAGIDGGPGPDPVDPQALAEIDLLFGERPTRSWRVPLGFLVMTNLRCVYVWRRLSVLRTSDWEEGPTFFFYNLAPPRIVARRFVELREDSSVDARAFRFLVRDPAGVCEEVESARQAGVAEWRARSARAQIQGSRPTDVTLPPAPTVIVQQIVKVRCRYCGNLMDERATMCPACGAPQR